MCSYCGTTLLPNETASFCCGNNRFVVAPQIRPLPPEFEEFLRSCCEHPGSDSSRAYNNTLSFTAIGVTGSDKGGFGFPRGGASLHVGGRLYHRIIAADKGKLQVCLDQLSSMTPPTAQQLADLRQQSL